MKEVALSQGPIIKTALSQGTMKAISRVRDRVIVIHRDQFNSLRDYSSFLSKEICSCKNIVLIDYKCLPNDTDFCCCLWKFVDEIGKTMLHLMFAILLDLLSWVLPLLIP